MARLLFFTAATMAALCGALNMPKNGNNNGGKGAGKGGGFLSGSSSSARWLAVASAGVASRAVASTVEEEEEEEAPLSSERKSWFGRPRLRKRLSDVRLREKLGAVPVFYVSNARGAPYLISHVAAREQEAILFLEPEEAEDLLEQMAQANGVKDARMYCMGLDKAFDLMRRGPSSSGNKDRKGGEFSLHYRLKPGNRALNAASWRLGPRLFHKTMVPLFVARDLSLSKRGEKDARPAFFRLDDLNTAWEDCLTRRKKPYVKPVVFTYNLVDLVLASDLTREKADFDKLVFFPDPDSVNYVRRAKKRGNLSARMHSQL